MQPFFRDAGKQQEFEEKGYVVLPFLDPAEVAELKAYYATLDFVGARVGLCSVIGERPEMTRQLRDVFASIGAEASNRHFVDSDLLLGNFLVKRSGAKTLTPPHQDWTMIDATHQIAAVAWVPLDDVDTHNGAMGVIPGSHTVFPDVCCAPSMYGRELLPYARYAMDLFPYLDLRPLKAGEALLFNSTVVHGSTPNMGPVPRLAATFSLAPRGTGFRLPYLLPDTSLSKYELFEYGIDAFVEFDNTRLTTLFDAGARPAALTSYGVHELQRTRLDSEEAIARLEAIGCRRLNGFA